MAHPAKYQKPEPSSYPASGNAKAKPDAPNGGTKTAPYASTNNPRPSSHEGDTKTAPKIGS